MTIYRKFNTSKSFLLLFFIFYTLPAKADDALKNYTLGEGLRFSNIHISGYLTVEAEAHEQGKKELLIDDLSFFVNARVNKFINPFIEVELTKVPLLIEGEGLFSGKDPKVVLERFYNDSHLNNQLTLRLGKSLTPIGEWNSIHAGPLVPTTKRPMTTYRSFSEYISGVSVIYEPQNDNMPTLTAYWQPEGSFSSNPKAIDNREFRDMKGIALSWNWGLENLLGFNFQQSGVHQIGYFNHETQYLIGANIHLVKNNFELQSELTHVWLKDTSPVRMRSKETGLFIQGIYNFSDNWAVMSRYEYFADRDFLESSKNALVGVKYSPKPPVVWKLEYVEQWGQKLNIGGGLFASLAVLF